MMDPAKSGKDHLDQIKVILSVLGFLPLALTAAEFHCYRLHKVIITRSDQCRGFEFLQTSGSQRSLRPPLPPEGLTYLIFPLFSLLFFFTDILVTSLGTYES